MISFCYSLMLSQQRFIFISVIREYSPKILNNACTSKSLITMMKSAGTDEERFAFLDITLSCLKGASENRPLAHIIATYLEEFNFTFSEPLFRKIINNFIKVSTGQYGLTIWKPFLKRANPFYLKCFRTEVVKAFVLLSCDQFGNFYVTQLVREAQTDAQTSELISLGVLYFDTLILSNEGNYVICALLEAEDQIKGTQLRIKLINSKASNNSLSSRNSREILRYKSSRKSVRHCIERNKVYY